MRRSTSRRSRLGSWSSEWAPELFCNEEVSAHMRAKEDEMDLGKCGRCGLAVSAGICDTPPLQFHDRPEQCIEALKAELARVRESAILRLIIRP